MWHAQLGLEFPDDAAWYPWVDDEMLGTSFVYTSERIMENVIAMYVPFQISECFILKPRKWYATNTTCVSFLYMNVCFLILDSHTKPLFHSGTENKW